MDRRQRKHFTPHEHLLLGAELSELRMRLMALMMVVQDAYGKGAAAPFFRVYQQVEKLKSGYEDRLCNEIPRSVQDIEGVPVTKVYYGWVRGPCPPWTEYRNERDDFQARAVNVFDEFGNPWTKEK